MTAMLMDRGRHANVVLIQEGVEAGEYRPVTIKVTSHHCPTTETAKERQARHAEATGTKRGMWK